MALGKLTKKEFEARFGADDNYNRPAQGFNVKAAGDVWSKAAADIAFAKIQGQSNAKSGEGNAFLGPQTAIIQGGLAIPSSIGAGVFGSTQGQQVTQQVADKIPEPIKEKFSTEASKLKEGYDYMNPEQQLEVRNKLGIIEGTLAVAGLRTPTPKIKPNFRLHADYTINPTDDVFSGATKEEIFSQVNSVREGIQSFAGEKSVEPTFNASATRLIEDGASIAGLTFLEGVAGRQNNIADLYENYLSQAQAHLTDAKLDPPLAQVGEDIGDMFNITIQQQRDIGALLGKELQEVGSLKVGIQDSVTNALKMMEESGLSYNPVTKIFTSFQGSKFAEGEIDMLSEFMAKVRLLGKEPTVTQIDNFIARTRSELDFTKGNSGVNKVTNAERIVNTTLHNLRQELNPEKNGITQLNKYWSLNEAYKDAKDFVDEGGEFLGKVTQSGDYRRDASILKSAVQSMLNAGKKDWLLSLEARTGFPALDYAVLALQAMKDAGDYKGPSLLQAIKDQGVPTSKAGLVGAIIDKTADAGKRAVLGKPEEQTRAYLRSLGAKKTDLTTADKPIQAKLDPELKTEKLIKLEGEIKKNVIAQEKALKANNIPLLKKLKEAFIKLKNAVLAEIKFIKDNIGDESGFVNLFGKDGIKKYKKQQDLKKRTKEEAKAQKAREAKSESNFNRKANLEENQIFLERKEGIIASAKKNLKDPARRQQGSIGGIPKDFPKPKSESLSSANDNTQTNKISENLANFIGKNAKNFKVEDQFLALDGKIRKQINANIKIRPKLLSYIDTGFSTNLDDITAYIKGKTINGKPATLFDLSRQGDKGAKRLIAESKGATKPLSLREAIDYPELFRAYPAAKNILVQVKDDLDGYGSFDINENGVPKIIISGEDALETLKHEIQHYIQAREGFAIGGSQTVLTNASVQNIILKKQLRNVVKDRELYGGTRVEDMNYLKTLIDKTGSGKKLSPEELGEVFGSQKEYEAMAYRAYRKLYGEIEANANSKSELLSAKGALFGKQGGISPIKSVKNTIAGMADHTIQTKRDVVAKTVSGERITIPSGTVIKPMVDGGKVTIKLDGKTFVIPKNQYQNLVGQSDVAKANPFAPELEGTVETVKGQEKMKVRDKAYADFDAGKITREERNKIIDELGVPNETKYSQYTLPGGENYREILIQEPETLKKGEYDTDVIDKSKTYRSSHWSEPNVISHIRMNERTVDGKKYAFMEELQSDWAREGRDKGFAADVSGEIAEAESIAKKYGYSLDDFSSAQNNKADEIDRLSDEIFNQATPTEQKRLSELSDVIYKTANDKGVTSKIPNNPLLKNWQIPTTKRALMEAVDSGADRFAWINGEQTSARYNLATYLDEANWKTENGGDKLIKLNTKNKDDIIVGIDKEGVIKEGNSEWRGKKLDEVLGKGLADKIMEKETGTLSGDGLSFGGEWAKNLYDRQVRDIVKKLTGAEVKTVDMGLGVGKEERYKILGSNTFASSKNVQKGDIVTDKSKDDFYVINRRNNGEVDLISAREIRLQLENDYDLYNKYYPKSERDGEFVNVSKEEMNDAYYQAIDDGVFAQSEMIKTVNLDDVGKQTQQYIELTPEVKAKIQSKVPVFKMKNPSSAEALPLIILLLGGGTLATQS